MGSELPAPPHRPAYELSTHRRENTRPNNKITHLNLLKRTAKAVGRSCTHKICVCLSVNKQVHKRTNSHKHGCKLFSFASVCDNYSWWSQMENNLHLLTRPDDTKTHAHFYRGRLLWPFCNENHMMDHIQVWKTAENLHPEKISTNKTEETKITREDSQAKLSGELIPAIL